MTFKIGDEVIMTAAQIMQLKRGTKVIVTLKNTIGRIKAGEHIAFISQKFGNPKSIELQYQSINKHHRFRERYYMDDFQLRYPGMSIRLANPVNEEIRTYSIPDIENKAYIATPSQWIEGQIPDDYRGWAWLWYIDNPESQLCRIIVPPRSNSYTHWMPAVLPPPPPAKEVEAFGYLEFCDKYVKDWQDYSEGGVDKADKARSFYSQPATAENLNKYFKIEGGISWYDKRKNIDQYIFWYHDRYDYKLLFTPAALEELGIK